MVGGVADPGVDQLGDVDAEQVGAGLVAGAQLLEQGRVVDLDRPAGQLGVAGPGGRVVGRVDRGAVEGQPGVAAEVEGLAGPRHHAQPQLPVGDGGLDPADPGRAVPAQGGQGLVLVGVEGRPGPTGQLGGGRLDLAPGRHGQSLRAASDRVGPWTTPAGWETVWQFRSPGEPMTESRTQAGGGPTVQRMLVGARLRRLRTDLGLTREEAAQAIRASEWKIHRLENGQVGFKDRDIIDLLARYQVTDPAEVAEFLTLAREANTPGWWQHYGDVLPQLVPHLRRPGTGRHPDPQLRRPVRPRAAPDRRLHAGGGPRAPTWRNRATRWAAGSGCAWPARSC